MLLVSIMWDDGLVSDLRLISILKRLGVTSTFAISPSRHQINRVVNDMRGDYGELVSRSELKEFAEFEICNHTSNHLDLGKLDKNTTKKEIVEGRQKLEDIFSKRVNGFCYPYGVYTTTAVEILAEEGVKYARTTKPSMQFNDCLLLHPNGKWSDFNLDIIDKRIKRLILWGHTYELRTEKDWVSVTDFYAKLASDPRFKIVTFNDILD